MGAKQAALAALACALAACGSSAAPEAQSTAREPTEPNAHEATEGNAHGTSGEVMLTAEEVAHLGIQLTAAKPVAYSPGPEGFATVVSHDTIAQAAADLQVANATTKQSEAALQRARHLASGPGSLGTEAVDVATRQAASDRAALQLARRKLTATFGAGFPLAGPPSTSALDSLANGEWKLVRVTFPVVGPEETLPSSVRLTRVDVGASSTSWESSTIWDAPDDPSLPGRSFFALVKQPNLPEGARLRAVAVFRHATSGVLIPESGVVMSNGQSWCFVRRGPGQFERVVLDLSRPLPGGYFMSSGIEAGQEIVTTAAGLLLARQSSPARQEQGED